VDNPQRIKEGRKEGRKKREKYDNFTVEFFPR